MENEEGPGTVVEIASTKRRKSPARHPASGRAAGASPRKPRKTAARPKAPAKRRRSRR